MLPCPGYYKQCCDEHWGTRVSFNSGFEEGFFEELIFELDIGRVEEVVDVGKKTGKSGTWRQLRCPSADEWIRKLWYIYTMEYYSAIKKNTFESVSVELETLGFSI